MTSLDPLNPATLGSLAEYLADVLCRADMDGVITYASPSCFALLGCTPEEMVGKAPHDVVFPDDLGSIQQAMAAFADPAVAEGATTVRLMRKDGSLVWAETRARIIRDPATQEPLELVMMMRDVSERKRLEEQLETLAMTDSLTGLMNRRAFDTTFDAEWRRVVREASQTSLLMIDVDRFKLMNDMYGHGMGDDCLRVIARGIARCLHRPCDLAARYGGEEFAVILPGSEMAGASAVAERIRLCIQEMRLTHEGNPEGGGVVTVSVGVATALARHGGTLKMPESLLMAADTALYKAKLEGRNRIATGMLLTSPGVRADARGGNGGGLP